MKKTHKVVMLLTNKKAKLGQLNLAPDNTNPLELIHYVITGEGLQPQHLYIISDDEIKEGDLCLFFWDGGELGSDKPQQYQPSKGHVLNNGLKKIVATTDKSITKDIATSGKFYEPLPQIPESFIQAYIKAYNDPKVQTITEVDLEMEVDSELWNDEIGTKNGIPMRIKTRPDNTVIVHQSKMYSRDEVIKLMDDYKDYSSNFNKGEKRLTASEYINTI